MKFPKIFLLTTFFVLVAFSQETKSADFYVDQNDSGCADDGSASKFCTISAAINLASDEDNIFIGEGVYSEANIDVIKILNISGVGIDKTIINSSGGYGFNFYNTSGDPRVINLSNLSIKNADDPAIFSFDVNLCIKNSSFEDQTSNGVILVQNSVINTYSLIIEDSTFVNNKTSFSGSVINSENGNLVINRSGFTGNFSTNDGTIYLKDGNMTITDSSMSNNFSDNGASIYQDGGELTILNTAFENNTATNSGGVLFLKNNVKLSIKDSVFTKNFASAYSVLYKDSGTSQIETTEFSENTSTSGPTVYQNLSSGVESSMAISDSTFTYNETSNGGTSAVLAVYGSALTRSSLEIYNSIFDHNTNQGDDEAGDFIKSGAVDIGCYTNSLIKKSTFSNNTGKAGGAVYIDKCDVDGDGISETMGEAYIINSTFFKNTSTENGGAFYNDGVLVLENVTIANNESISANGGGIYDSDSNNTSIHNSILANNIAPIGPDCFSSIHSEGYNIVSDSSDCTLTNDDEGILDTDYLDSDANVSDSLADNGGTTQTLSLNPGSLALNTGSDCRDETGTDLTTSQNGLDRPQGSSCDRGSFEGGCGDGVVQSDFSEECDDENIVNGDGCDNTCKIEAVTTTSGDTSSGDTTSGGSTSGDSTSGDTSSGGTTSGDSTGASTGATGTDDSSGLTGGESTGTDDSGATTTGATDAGTTTSGSDSGSTINLGEGNSITDGGGCSLNISE